MKQRIVTLLLTAGCAVFGVIGFFVYAGQDHTAPKIKVEKQSITYTEGEDYAALLAGISAKDNIDGDLSDKVFVDKIVPTQKGKAVVYYGVMDQSKNVGTARRKITYHPAAEEKVFIDSEEKPDKTAENAETEKKKESEEEQTELLPDGVNPALALTATEVTIKKGETFDPLSIVKDAVDDKDDKNTLYQHIHADGKYNTKQAGTYEIRYYVSDSDKHTSSPQIVKLIVE